MSIENSECAFAVGDLLTRADGESGQCVEIGTEEGPDYVVINRGGGDLVSGPMSSFRRMEPTIAEGYVDDDREVIDPEFADTDSPTKPDPITGLDAWEGLVEMPKKTYTLKRGNFQITLTEPEDYKAIESAYSAPDDADKLALAISAQARVRIKGEVVNAIRMIRTCCPKESRPSEATLARISVKHPGTFNQLAMAAMELCGLMNVDAVKDAAAEAFLP